MNLCDACETAAFCTRTHRCIPLVTEPGGARIEYGEAVAFSQMPGALEVAAEPKQDKPKGMFAWLARWIG